MDINETMVAVDDSTSVLFSADEMPEMTAAVVLQKSLIENTLLTLFEKGGLTAQEVRVIVRSAGVSLAAEVAEWRTAAENSADERGADRMAAAGEVYLEELEESILGQPDSDILLGPEADAEQ